MAKKPTLTCPVSKDFHRWWLNRANLNARRLAKEGRPIRAANYTVTEEQVNRQYKLLKKKFTPGEVFKKLHECEIPVVDVKPGEYNLGWNPRLFDNKK